MVELLLVLDLQLKKTSATLLKLNLFNQNLTNLIHYPFKSQPYKMFKHTHTILRQQLTNCLSVFDHFVMLTSKESITKSAQIELTVIYLTWYLWFSWILRIENLRFGLGILYLQFFQIQKISRTRKTIIASKQIQKNKIIDQWIV